MLITYALAGDRTYVAVLEIRQYTTSPLKPACTASTDKLSSSTYIMVVVWVKD